MKIATGQISRFWHRIDGVLLLRLLFSLLLTAVIALLCEKLFLRQSRGIKIRFDLQCKYRNGDHLKLFYLEGKNWKSLPPIQLKSAGGKIRAYVPAKTLAGFRLDFGALPGQVVCSKFQVNGKRSISLKDMKCTGYHQLSDVKLLPDGLTCSTSGNNPQISFQFNKVLKERKKWHISWPAFGIVTIPAFIILLAFSRLFLLAGHRNLLYWADVVLVLVFAAVLFTPASFISGETISSTENRKLAEFPPLILNDNKINYNYGKAFEAWFNDHFFGRSQLLAFNAWLQSLVRSPFQPYEKVYCGFSSWYFYSLDNSLRNYHNLDLFEEKKLAGVVDDLKKLQELCKRKNKKMYILIIPDKHKVYGEYFCAAPKIRPDSKSRARQFERYLKKNGIVNVIYLLDVLLENKKQDILYWKTDTHWNMLGAFIGYQAFMEHIRKDFPDIPVCEKPKIKKVTRPIGDLTMLSNNQIGKDFTLYPVLDVPMKYKIQSGYIDSVGHPCRLVNPAGKYNLLLLRDSFSSSLLPYLGNSFKSVTALWTVYHLPANEIDVFRKADIIVFQCVERYLPALPDGIHYTRINIEQGVR